MSIISFFVYINLGFITSIMSSLALYSYKEFKEKQYASHLNRGKRLGVILYTLCAILLWIDYIYLLTIDF